MPERRSKVKCYAFFFAYIYRDAVLVKNHVRQIIRFRATLLPNIRHAGIKNAQTAATPAISEEEKLYGKKRNGNEQCGNKVERMAVFYVQQTKSGTNYQNPADNGNLGNKVVRNSRTRQFGYKIKRSLPAKQHNGCESHAYAVRGSQYSRCYEIEHGVSI